MAQLLQSAADQLAHLFEPANLVQLAVIGASVALGWWPVVGFSRS